MQQQKQQKTETVAQTQAVVKESLKGISDKLQKEQAQLIQSIRDIQNSEVELEVNEQLTEDIKDKNKAKIRQIVKQVVSVEKKIETVNTLNEKTDELQQKQYSQIIDNQSKDYQPTEDVLNNRYTELTQQANDSNWTDATQSQADDDQIWAVDEQIMRAMEQDEQEFDEEEEIREKQEQGESQKKQQINIDQLQKQFVTGQESDHQVLFGKHDKFCVSVNGLYKNDLLLSGGGDDYLYMYHFPKEEVNKDKCLAPYHMVKHTETVNKIQVSYSKQFVFTMTDNQILCTQIKTQQTTKLKSKSKQSQKQEKSPQNQDKIEEVEQQEAKLQIKQQIKQEAKQEVKQEVKKMNEQKGQGSESSSEQEPDDDEPICSDMVCHHLGDVVVISSGYELQVYNIKGLKLYQTYYCEKMIETVAFTQTGKQIVLACEDDKLRLLTPKTSEIITIGGVKQHKSQISVIKTKGDIILTGCIEGYIGITSIKKATMTALIGTKQTEDVDGAINVLEFAGNYFIAGSSNDYIDWYDLSKAKKLFQSPIEGSASDIRWQGSEHPHLYSVSTIKGFIHLFDCRNPLKQVARTRAGNTIHQLWSDGFNLAAACQDGNVRLFDVRKLL